MSRFKDTLRGVPEQLRGLPERIENSLSKREATRPNQDTIRILDSQFFRLEGLKVAFFKPVTLAADRIRVENLEVPQGGREPAADPFFQTSPASGRVSLPFVRDSSTRLRLDCYKEQDEQDHSSKTFRTKETSYNWNAEHFAGRVDFSFNAPREGMEVHDIQMASAWLPMETGEEIFLSKQFYNSVQDLVSRWTITGSYIPWRSFRDYPHVMVVLRHSVEATDELLRGEVLSILEAMSTRLGLPKFKKHVNVPVMIISVINDRGRILQSHWNGQDVVIRKSPLIDLTAKNWENINTLTWYMAKNPAGDTKSLRGVQPAGDAQAQHEARTTEEAIAERETGTSQAAPTLPTEIQTVQSPKSPNTLTAIEDPMAVAEVKE